MESVKKIVDKMEAPLLFATGNAYERLPLVKNLETAMTFLLRRLREELHSEPQPRSDELDMLSYELLKLFDGYDSVSQKQKKDRLAKAIGHLSALKAITENPNAIIGGGRYSSIKIEQTNTLLSLPIMSVRGVGPRTVELLAKKNLTNIEDLLYFLPRRYEDRRTVYRISETVPGIKQTIAGKITFAVVHFYGNPL